MKVMHLTTHVNIGGIGNYILNLSRAFRKKGIDVIVASSGGNLEAEFASSGIRHMRLNIRTKFEFSPKVFTAVPALCRALKREDVDIIHAHTRVSQVLGLLASLVTGLPLVTTCHGFFKKRSRAIFDTWGTRVIAISDDVRKHLRRDMGVSDSRIEVIYSGVDVDRFARRYSDTEKHAIKSSIGLKDCLVVGTIGRLSKVKGHRFLIEAAGNVLSKNEDVEFVIVGNGEEGPFLKDLARSLGIEKSIHFIDSDTDTAKFLAIMDIFVFPSVKEGLGIALLEAMAAGKACVASGVGGIKNIITGGSDGMLVGSCDPIALGDAILLLAGDESIRNKMGSAGHELAKKRFTLDAMAENVIGLYDKVTAQRRSRMARKNI
jgi:glycosyltransferase involved in cell wall biosynthesis